MLTVPSWTLWAPRKGSLLYVMITLRAVVQSSVGRATFAVSWSLVKDAVNDVFMKWVNKSRAQCIALEAVYTFEEWQR